MSKVIRCSVVVSTLFLTICARVPLAQKQERWHGPPTRRMSVPQRSGLVGNKLRTDITDTIDRSLDWLATKQNADGFWSDRNCPALTALPVRAFAASKHKKKTNAVAKGVLHILSCVRKDGGICVTGAKGKGGLANYNTAICMAALHATGDASLLKTVRNARKFITNAQYLGSDDYRGGFGYDRASGTTYADLRSTFYALDAMAETASAETYRPPGEARIDINWNETVKYVKKAQNTGAAGPGQAGGFSSKPSDGRIFFRSYGSMTYSGMLALIHADVSRDDVRVRSAFDWSVKHWSLKENPGMGGQGLYFFYNVLARTLSVYDRDIIRLADGRTSVNWRVDLARKIMDLQKKDPKTGHGYWSNKDGRFWENDPVLVTAYAVLTLQTILKE